MGNCVFRSFAEDEEEEEEAIKVMTPNGGVMLFDGPLTAECITNDYPAHGIFRLGLTSQPLPRNEELLNGESYYLLPLEEEEKERRLMDHHLPCAGADQLLPRISTHTISTATTCKKPCLEMLPKQRNGVWRVKLVITPEQLTEILSEESNTEALIESVRTVAKCGHDHDQIKWASRSDLGNCNSWKPSVETISEVAVVEKSVSGGQMDRWI